MLPGMTPFDLIRSGRAAGYYVHYLQPTQIAQTCAMMFGRKFQALATLRRD